MGVGRQLRCVWPDGQIGGVGGHTEGRCADGWVGDGQNGQIGQGSSMASPSPPAISLVLPLPPPVALPVPLPDPFLYPVTLHLHDTPSLGYHLSPGHL